MTVRRLLQEADSLELTCWQAFLIADAARREEQRNRDREDREIMGDG